MPKKDYIPYSDAEFDEWFRNFAANISVIATRLEIPPAMITAVTTAYANWQPGYAAQQAAKNAHQAATEIKDELRDTGKEAVRPLVGILQAHPGLTDWERKILGITVPDRKPTPASPEYVASLPPPLLLLDWSGRGLVVVHFGVNPSNEKNNAKPPGLFGAQIWCRQNGGDWEYVAADTNSPYTHNFSITKPASVEYRAQWLDKQMRPGVFSETAKCTVSP
jgi:hypothetical protein